MHFNNCIPAVKIHTWGGLGSQLYALALSIDLGIDSIWGISRSGELPRYDQNLKSFKLIKGDLSDYRLLESLPEFDAIIHAGGYAQPTRFMEDPLSTISVNTSSTIELIKKLKDNGKFLYLSSSEVYSGSKNFPHEESDVGQTNTEHPRVAYIEGKKVGETIIAAARSRLSIDATAIRLSLVYGPGTKPADSRVINSIISQALNNRVIKLLDSGTAIRSYCYVSDAIFLSLTAMLNGTESIYNVGGISKVSIKELAEKIAKLTQAKVQCGLDEGMMSGAPINVELNLNKIIKLSRIKKFVDLEVGLPRTIKWHEYHVYRTRLLS